MLPGGLQPLCGYRQFILYHLVRRPDGKVDKIPHSPHTLEACDAHHPQHWADYDTAHAMSATLGDGWGVGFVLTERDPFFCLDMDHCWAGDRWSNEACAVADALPGVAIEVSQSRESLHFWGMTAALEHRTRPNPDAACPWPRVELYTKRRFIALTGNVVGGHAATVANLAPIVDAWFQPQARSTVDADEWNLEPVVEWRGPVDDDDLLRRALHSQSANAVWGAGVTFADLWTANADALGKRWPADAGKATAWNESHADAALAAHLAFWTGKHHQRIAELMLRSALVRPKWDREDYLPRTIRLACSANKDVLQDAPVVLPSSSPALMPAPPTATVPVPPDPVPTAEAEPAPLALVSDGGKPISTMKQGRTTLGAAEQQQLFEGCVYIRRTNRVYAPGVAYTLDRQQFDATYGGRQFITAEGKIAKSPWEAFTQNSVVEFPRVDDEDFSPLRKTGSVYANEYGEWVVNTYLAPRAMSCEGNVALWWAHMEKLFPRQHDRDIFMAWVCAMVRYPGRKFSWAPILISGEGVGKTIMFDAIRAAMGQRYTRGVRGSTLAGRFNDWIGNTLLCVVEDFRMPKSADRDDLLEKLKEMVAGGEMIESEAKGEGVTNTRNVCNFLFSGNRLDVLRIDEKTRRFCAFVLGMWSENEVLARGMDAHYFVRLKAWFRSAEGIAALRHLFLTWPIPDHLNPATHCVRAPKTTTGDEMFKANADAASQVVEEAVMAGLWGFRDGWALPDAVKTVLEKERMTITSVGAGRLLERLGYVPHPSLEGGWSMNPVPPFNKRSKIYLHHTSPHCHHNLKPGEVVRLFTAAQESSLECVPMFGRVDVPGMMQ